MEEPHVRSVERALSILEALGAGRPVMSLAELAAETGPYNSTLLRLSASLIRFGHLRRREDGRFPLGPALGRLGSLYRSGYEMAERARPALRQLARETGETASFYVLDGDERLCLYRKNSKDLMRHHLEEGARLWLRHGAAGHVLAAGILDLARARDLLRPDGGCVSVDERNPLVVALAVLVRGPAGRPVGALSPSGPKARIDPADHDRLIEMLLLRTAAALGRPEPGS